MKRIAAIILAAGESKRMGMPKMLLPFGSSTMIGTVISLVQESGIDDITVVLGAEKERISAEVQKKSVNFCFNRNYRNGMLSSVICGIGSIGEEFDGVMIFPGDQPLIDTRTVRKVMDAFMTGEKGLVVPLHKGRRGHPLIIGKKYLGEVSGLDQAKGLKEILARHREDIAEVKVDDSGILKDFDTYDDYLKEINQTS